MKCFHDQDCGFLFHCDSDLNCQHDSVFPLSIFTVLIYLVIPIGSGLVNATGHSMGLFKVLIVMNLLRYQGIQATMVSQAMIVGTAVPNYFSMLVRKHPTLPISLVNFNLVYILVPCCLLGSTLGSLITQFIPNLIQQILTFLVFSYFCWSFYQKYRKIKQKQSEYQSSILTNQNNVVIAEQIKQENNTIADAQSYIASNQQKLVKNSISLPSNNQNQLPSDLNSLLKIQIIQYQKSIHLRDIVYSIAVFVIFQFLVFLVQGKLPFLQFDQCNWKYWTGLCILISLTLAYLKFIHAYLKKKFQIYERLQIQQQIMLNKNNQFNFILLAGFLAGTVQGILGVGSGSCMMTFLLTTSINAQSASATSGYQVLFIGLAALIEGFINDEIILVDTAFFILLCMILGGGATLGLAYFLQKRDQGTVSKFVVVIAVFLSMVSVIMVIPDVISLINEDGIEKTMEIKFSCNK